jgi:microcystin degradation protein MlrC
MTRIGIAGIWQETNTYSSHSTTLEDFAAFELLEGSAIVDHHSDTESVIGGFLAGTDHEVVPVFTAGAWPSGPASADIAEHLLDRLAESLGSVGPLDGVLVNLHGAMVTEGHPDFEADTLAVIRQQVGDVPVVGVLDFHANPSVRLTELADVLIAYDTYPHIDMFDRGREAAVLVGRLIDGEPLRTRIGKHPLLTTPLAQATGSQPMAGLFAEARSLASKLGIDRVCITGGFPYSDVDRAGVSVLVTAREELESECQTLIATLLSLIDEVGDQFEISRPGPAEAVAMGLDGMPRPVVLADIADNIGGGSAGDGTEILEQLVKQGATGALVVIADAEIAAAAHAAGVGGTISGHLGAKTDKLHGAPVPFTGDIVGLSDGRYTSRGSWAAGLVVNQGLTAWLSVDGIDVVVTEFPRPPFHVEQVTHLGIDPAAASIIVAKGAVAWRAAYGEMAASVVEVDAAGVCPVDLSKLPRTTTPVRYP